MATFKKFKLLAICCATARSPPRRPAASGAATCFHFPRRKALKVLVRVTQFRRMLRRRAPPGGNPTDLVEKKSLITHALKDLFMSSPPPLDGGGGPGLETGADGGVERRLGFEGIAARRSGSAPRFGSAGLRCRLWRRASRPVLFTIPE